MDGYANIHRVSFNTGDKHRGLIHLTKWLNSQSGNWDIIIFNFGIWDFSYRDPSGQRYKKKGKLVSTTSLYTSTLEK